MDDAQRQIVRNFLLRAAAALDTDLTGLARQAGVAASTITRFVNKADSKFLPSTRTLMKVSRASGVALPVELGAAERLSSAERIEAVHAVARTLGVDLPELTPRLLQWLDAIQHISPAAEDHAFHLISGMRQPGRPTQENTGPGETSRTRRRG